MLRNHFVWYGLVLVGDYNTTYEGQNIPSDLQVQHVHSSYSETVCFAADLSPIQTRGRSSENVCPCREKGGRHQKDLFGTETQISLGFWTEGVKWGDSDESSNRRDPSSRRFGG